MKALGIMLVVGLCTSTGATAKSPLDRFNCNGADRVHIQGNDTTRPPTVGDTRDISNPAQIGLICRFPSTLAGSWHKAAFDAPLLRWKLTFYRDGKLIGSYDVGANFIEMGLYLNLKPPQIRSFQMLMEARQP
jgi:hypothetical protein